MLGIAEAGESIGLRTMAVKVSIEKLVEEAPLPCILHWGQNHFVVLHAVKKWRKRLSGGSQRNLWGGRRSPSNEDYDAFSERRDVSDYENLQNLNPRWSDSNGAGYRQSDLGRDQSSYEFYIADPAKGSITLDSEEFSRKWLSGNSVGQLEGIALLLEPTSRFFQEEGEEVKKLDFSHLLGLLFRYKKLVAQLGLGVLVGSGLNLLLPFLTQSVVDVGIGTQNLSFINLVLISQLVLLLSTSSVDFLRSWILLHISTRLNLTILSEFLSKLMRLPVSFFDVKQFGDIMQRIGDHHRIEAFLTGQTLAFIFSFFNLVVFGFVLAVFHLPIFVTAITLSAMYAAWVILFLKQRRKLDSRRFEISSRNQSQVIQLIQGMQDIKLAGAETAKRWEWERTQARLFKWSVKSLSLAQYQQAGAILINQSKNIFITYLAARAVVNGELTLGGMVSIQYILGQFNGPIEQMIAFLQSWQDAQMSLERLNEIHNLADEEPLHEMKRMEWAAGSNIELKSVSYTYPGAGNDPVLRNIDLTIFHGKTTAIVGSSGSGKTTLLKLLLRFYDVKTGNITLASSGDDNKLSLETEGVSGGGVDLRNISQKAWRRQCGVVMQEGFIFSDSIARNIAVGVEVIDQEKLYHAARIANVHEFIESLPLGYHTKIGAEGNGISQGQKQRILIARSIYKDPQLLLFDEATNALDSKNEATIIRNLVSFFKGRTVVVVAHRLSTVKNAEQILVLEKGEIVEIGTHADLVHAKGKYFELVSNQLELAQ